MYHETIAAVARIHSWPDREIPLRQFLQEHMEPLGYAAALLAGQKGIHVVSSIRDSFQQSGPISWSGMHQLDALVGILALENVPDGRTEEAAHFSAIDPTDPIVDEICVLTDGLREAMASLRSEPGAGSKD